MVSRQNQEVFRKYLQSTRYVVFGTIINYELGGDQVL